MRIIHFVDSLDPAMGGPPMSVAGLAAAQAKLGYQVFLVTNESPGREKQITKSLGRVPDIELLKIISLPHGNLFQRTAGFAAEKIINELVEPGDVIHIHGMWRPMLKAACHVTSRKGVKYVLSPRGMLHPWALRQKHWKKRLAMWLGWRAVIRNAAFIHALNADEARYIGSLGLSSTTRIIPNGIFTEQLVGVSDAVLFLKAHPELSGRSYILFLGRLHYVKGLDYLAAAFKKFSDIRQDVDLVVAGPDGGARDRFMNDVETLGVKARVHLVGPLYGDEKYAAMLGASCFCQPSRQEGFSMAATEAMACGLPVILSDQCNFPEVAEAGAGEIVVLDSDALSESLVNVLGNEARRKAMGEAARKLVLFRYTWPKIAEMSIAAYSDMNMSKEKID